MVVRTALACFSWRRRQPVLQVMEYLTHAACLSTGASVHFVYKPFTYYRRLSCSDGLQGKKKSHPPTARGGVAKSNIQTGVGVVRLPSSLLPFPLCTLYSPLAYSYWGLSLFPCSYLYATCVILCLYYVPDYWNKVIVIVQLYNCFIFSLIKTQCRLYDIRPRYLGAYWNLNF